MRKDWLHYLFQIVTLFVLLCACMLVGFLLTYLFKLDNANTISLVSSLSLAVFVSGLFCGIFLLNGLTKRHMSQLAKQANEQQSEVNQAIDHVGKLLENIKHFDTSVENQFFRFEHHLSKQLGHSSHSADFSPNQLAILNNMTRHIEQTLLRQNPSMGSSGHQSTTNQKTEHHFEQLNTRLDALARALNQPNQVRSPVQIQRAVDVAIPDEVNRRFIDLEKQSDTRNSEQMFALDALRSEVANLKKALVDHTSKSKGDLFEEFIVLKLLAYRRDLIAWRGDKSCKYGEQNIYPPSNRLPDLEYEHRFPDGYTYNFAIECKWRQRWDKGDVVKLCHDQGRLQEYAKYELQGGRAVFLILGVGGEPDAPEELFCIRLFHNWVHGRGNTLPKLRYMLNRADTLRHIESVPSSFMIDENFTALQFELLQDFDDNGELQKVWPRIVAV